MQWLESLPYHAWFWGSAAPVPAPTAEPILSRLSQDPRSLILRAGRGLYFKAHPDDVSKDWGCDLTVSALLCAGDGAGLHRSGALNALGWSTQRPVKINVATLRPLEPYSPYVRYHLRRNEWRAHLTWNETTMLEALLSLRFAELDWGECLSFMREGGSANRLPWRDMIPFGFRAREMQQAVEHEQTDNLALLRHQIDEVCSLAPFAAGK